MGCYPNRVKPPQYILVYRDNIEDEPTVEEFDYTNTGKLSKNVEQSIGLNEEDGAFVAIYELKTARFVTKAILDLEGKSHKIIS